MKCDRCKEVSVEGKIRGCICDISMLGLLCPENDMHLMQRQYIRGDHYKRSARSFGSHGPEGRRHFLRPGKRGRQDCAAGSPSGNSKVCLDFNIFFQSERMDQKVLELAGEGRKDHAAVSPWNYSKMRLKSVYAAWRSLDKQFASMKALAGRLTRGDADVLA